MTLKKVWTALTHLLDEEDPAKELIYDPVDVGAVIVGTLAGVGILYWLLWSLLVCEGGLFGKVVPFLQVVFTGKTLQDFGYEGYPFELGLFEGWVVNSVAFVLAVALLYGVWWVLYAPKNRPGASRKSRERPHG
ncbi:MAG: hypothetical protein IPP68_02160 [Elusimicrobia bacterium]|nr:hypothetical protein [Elusimicrobiota bacterium]